MKMGGRVPLLVTTQCLGMRVNCRAVEQAIRADMNLFFTCNYVAGLKGASLTGIKVLAWRTPSKCVLLKCLVGGFFVTCHFHGRGELR